MFYWYLLNSILNAGVDMKRKQEQKLIVTCPGEASKIIRRAKRGAAKHPILFHCTTTDAFLSILKTREFWLSNLKCVNDREEGHRITRPEYEKSFFVASFTYRNNVSRKHWREYASLDDGVLFSVSQSWFQRSAEFLTSQNDRFPCPIITDKRAGTDEYNRLALLGIPSKDIILFSIDDFGFYKVIYNNKLHDSIVNNGQISSPGCNGLAFPIQVIRPQVAGILKGKTGDCEREGCTIYKKRWKEEKEVRLKLHIQQVMTETGVVPLIKSWSPKAAVKLNKNAFSFCKIRFSPKYPKAKRQETLERIATISPTTNIKILH